MLHEMLKKYRCRARAHGKDNLGARQRDFARQRRLFAVRFAFAVCNLAFFSFLFYFAFYIDYLNMTSALHLYKCFYQYFSNTASTDLSSTPPPSPNLRVSEQTLFGESVIYKCYPSSMSNVTPASYVVHHYTFHHTSTHMI